jgi:hypothetical protein
MLSDEEPKDPVKPDGIAAPRLKPDAVQPPLSLLVTVIVYDTELPTVVDWLEGESDTVGFARTHVVPPPPPKVTLTLAPVLSAESTVKVTPASGSL